MFVFLTTWLQNIILAMVWYQFQLSKATGHWDISNFIGIPPSFGSDFSAITYVFLNIWATRK